MSCQNNTKLFKNSVRKFKVKQKFAIENLLTFLTPFQANSTKMHASLTSPHGSDISPMGILCTTNNYQL
jgi:hypothetical protein